MVDLVLGGIVALAAVRGFFKGFLAEFTALMGWLMCLVLVVALAEPVAHILPLEAVEPTGRYIASFAILLCVSLIAWSAFQKFLLERIREPGISTLDSLLGALFGAVLGGVLCILGLIFIRAVLPTTPEWWQESRLVVLLMEFEHALASLFGALRNLVSGLIA